MNFYTQDFLSFYFRVQTGCLPQFWRWFQRRIRILTSGRTRKHADSQQTGSFPGKWHGEHVEILKYGFPTENHHIVYISNFKCRKYATGSGFELYIQRSGRGNHCSISRQGNQTSSVPGRDQQRNEKCRSPIQCKSVELSNDCILNN